MQKCPPIDVTAAALAPAAANRRTSSAKILACFCVSWFARFLGELT